jgi:hypothetical protein
MMRNFKSYLWTCSLNPVALYYSVMSVTVMSKGPRNRTAVSKTYFEVLEHVPIPLFWKKPNFAMTLGS